MQGYTGIGEEQHTILNRGKRACGFGPLEELTGDVPAKYRRVSFGIALVWLCIVPFMVSFAPKLQGATSIAFDPPSGHQSAYAKDAMKEFWPQVVDSSIIVALVYSTNGAVIPTDPTLNTSVPAFSNELIALSKSKSEYDVLGMTVMDYYIAAELHSPLAKSFRTEHATVIAFQISTPGSTNDGSPFVDLVDDLRDWSKDLKKKYLGKDFNAEITGETVLTIDARKGTIKDASKADMIVIPVAFLILALFLGSFRLMLLPLVTIGACVGTAFALCYPIAKSMSVQSTTPQLMMSATLALNIDYNLFLLMRFQENIKLGMSFGENMRLLVTHTAIETVLGSGSLVSIAFFSMAIIPCEVLITTGICCGITIAVVVMVNITLTPSLLTLFSGFFTGESLKTNCCASSGENSAFRQVRDKITSFRFLSNNNQELTMINEHESVEEDELKKTAWYRIGKQIQRAPIVVILVVAVLFSFLYIKFSSLTTSLDPLSFVPRNSESVEAWRRMADNFPPGEFEPYYVVLSKADNVSKTSLGYDMMYDVMEEVMNHTSIGLPEYIKPGMSPFMYTVGPAAVPVAFAPGRLMQLLATADVQPPFACCDGMNCTKCYSLGDVTVFTGKEYDIDACLQADVAKRPADCMLEEPGTLPYEFALRLNDVWRSGVVQPDIGVLSKYYNQSVETAVYFSVMLPFEPTGKLSKEWMDSMNTVMKTKQALWRGQGYPELDINLAGGNTVAYDFGKIVDDHMFIMLAVLVGAVTVVVMMIFRSLVIPPIMAITILYSVGCAFGMGYYFFDTTSFSWWYSYLDGDFKKEGVSWSVPPMVISITVALAIDYNIFMLTRIAEYKKMGKSSANAILSGMGAVGTTICGAGIIMSVAFGGLMFSHVVSLNQFSIILVTSVLLDTFLLSTIFVPACGFLLGDYFWWPSIGYYNKNTDEFDG